VADLNKTIADELDAMSVRVRESMGQYRSIPREAQVALDVAQDGLYRSGVVIEDSKVMIDGSGGRK
jgi:hypothetical protein